MKVWFTGLRLKLLMLSLIPSVSLVLSVWFSHSVTSDLKESLEKANLVRAPLITYSGEMMSHFNGIARWTVTAMWNYEDEKEKTMAINRAEKSIEEFNETFKSYVALPRSPNAREIFKTVENEWPALEETLHSVLEKLRTATKEDMQGLEDTYVKEARPRFAKCIATIQDLNKARNEIMAKELAEESAKTARSMFILLVSGLATVIASLVFMVVILRFIINQLNSVTTNLTEASSTLSGASQELSASSTEVAAGSSQTAASIQETVASLEELASMVKTTDESSQLSLQLAQQTHTQAQMGENKLNELVVALEEISKSAAKITDIIQVIDDISFQTNLLALNAAVEAARAGDQGKGFAVVAEAVRSLAQKSAVSAKEVGDLIRGSVEKTNLGVSIGTDCKEIMTGMFDSLKKVSDKSQEIAHSSREQTTGMEQISKAMNQLDQACQQNTAASEQISTASNQLSQQAINLGETVEKLKALVDGDQVRMMPTQATPSKADNDFFAEQKQKSRATKKAGAKNDFGLDDVA